MGGHQTQVPYRISRDFIAGRGLARTTITKKGKVKKKTPTPENNIPTTSKEQQCFKCSKFGHISSECTITTITNEEICLMTRGNSHTTGCDARMLGRKKADDYSGEDSKAVSKSDCDIVYRFSDEEARTIITKKGEVKKKTPAPESNIQATFKEQQCFKCHKFGHISSKCTITTITNEEICLMIRGNSHTTGCDANMLERKKAGDYSDEDSKAVSKSDCDLDYIFSDGEDSLLKLSLNKFSQSSSSNLSHRSTSSQSVERQQTHTSQRTIGAKPERDPRSKPEKGSFDIFRTTNVGLVKLNTPLHILNRQKKRESERFKNASEPQYLRSGMVLLKNCINIGDQVKVLHKCRELGIGSGGFYRPGYSNGTKLHLQMMCLGKDWDPDSKSYKDLRLFDGAQPPEIPGEFKKLVDDALHTAHNFLRKISKSVEEIPNMSPDVCIVNFYNSSGKLGLHQDIDESKESLEKELPVVSFSIGDSAEFLYGDVRDADKAEKIILESGDVLIFGGKSRLIFHGVSSVKPDTVPMSLTSNSALFSGRLNLTFRQV